MFCLGKFLRFVAKVVFIFQEIEIEDYYVVLPLRELIFGQLCRYLFTLYPIEVARPNWLKMKCLCIVILPWIVYVFIYFISFGFNETTLSSFQDIHNNLDKPDVLMRIGMLVFMLPVEFVWTHVYDAKKSSAGRSWLNRMTLMLTSKNHQSLQDTAPWYSFLLLLNTYFADNK